VAEAGCSQRLEACADPYDQIGESNEINNCASTGTGIGETDLGIYASNIRVTPPDPNVGEQVLIEVGLYSHRGTESSCFLAADWSLDGNSWFPIGPLLELHLPGGVEVFPYAASYVWAVPYASLQLRFRLQQICPLDINAYNTEAFGTLPWFVPPNTPVVVSDLEAESKLDGVVIRWRAEPAVAAFVLERRTAEEARWERLPESVPVAGGSGVAAYELLDRSARLGARLEYRLLGRMSDGSEERLGNVSVVHDATGLGAVQLLAVRPNPFHPGNAFEFTLPEPRDVDLCVFDAAGRRIAALRNGPQAAGRYAASWDGRDTAGRRVPAGVYFCRFVAGSFQQARRFVLVH
jgi:hypothetical protein